MTAVGSVASTGLEIELRAVGAAETAEKTAKVGTSRLRNFILKGLKVGV